MYVRLPVQVKYNTNGTSHLQALSRVTVSRVTAKSSWPSFHAALTLGIFLPFPPFFARRSGAPSIMAEAAICCDFRHFIFQLSASVGTPLAASSNRRHP